MSKFRLETTNEIIGSNSGIVLAGMILTGDIFKNQIYSTLGKQTKYSINHFTDYEIIKSYIGLLCVGKTSYESIDIFRTDKIFMTSLGMKKLPSKEILRQRLEKMNEKADEGFRIFTAEFIKKYGKLEFIKDTNYLQIDFDVTPFDNSNSSKEGVSWTYKNFIGFAPMITYIGTNGYMLNNEFREGKSHSNCKGTDDYIRRTIELARNITKDKKLLLRFDSGNDSVNNIFAINEYENVFFLIKKNLRGYDSQNHINQILASECIKEEIREGKIIYYHEENVAISKKNSNIFDTIIVRQISRVIKRTIDRKGQTLLFPDYEVAVWHTSIESDYDAKKIVEIYKDHGTSEQFHSELKTDMNIERLPSSKFKTNRLILSMGMVAFNILRLIGQEMINSGFHYRKRKVKRLRLRKVIQDIMYMAGKFLIKHKLPTLKLPKTNIFRNAFEFIFNKLQLE